MTGDRRGFTLVEVLTALAIGSIVLLAITSTLFALNRAYGQATELMEQQRALRSTVDLIRREISSAMYRPTDKLLRFQVKDLDYYGKPASALSLATVASPGINGVSDQILVQYLSQQQGEQILLSRSSRDYFQEKAVKANDYPLLERLEGFLVECHDGTKWVRNWDTELTRRLPKQVRITITVIENGKRISFPLVVLPRIDAQ